MTLHAAEVTLHLTPHEARRIGVALALLAHEAADEDRNG